MSLAGMPLPQRKRRKSPRALRFAEIKVGDQLMRVWDTSALSIGASRVTVYYVVTDLWFDPVAGQRDETSGRMVAIQRIDVRTGEPWRRKQAHTLRGLASQGYRYADVDYPAHVKLVAEAQAAGAVTPIGFGRVIRRRPKVPGPRPM